MKDTTTTQDYGTVRFHLQRNSQNDEAWADILGAPKKNSFFIYPNIPVSVGLVNEYAAPSRAEFNLIRIRQTWFWICFFGFLLYLFGLIRLATTTNVLRDQPIDGSSLGIIRLARLNPFSLARIQMAFWFSLVIVSYFFIWLITGATNILTTSTLALIGISAVTALSAVTIDNNKGQDLVKQTADLKDQENKLVVEIAGITPAVIAANPVMQATLAQKNVALTAVQNAVAKNINKLSQNLSAGFINDILTDENGVSFHRLQMLVWTFILGLLFVHSVWTRLSMPEFSATLLALQGLTAGTYLGFKIPEKQG